MPIDYSRFDRIGDSESDEEVEGQARLPKGLQGLSVEELLDYAKRRESQAEAERANSSPPDAVERKDEETADARASDGRPSSRRLRSLSGIPQYETFQAGFLGGLFETERGSIEFDEATGLLAMIKMTDLDPEHPFGDLVLRNDQAKAFLEELYDSCWMKKQQIQIALEWYASWSSTHAP